MDAPIGRAEHGASKAWIAITVQELHSRCTIYLDTYFRLLKALDKCLEKIR
jgi:hypothetical protein